MEHFKLSYRAAIDCIQLEFETAKPTHATTIKKKLGIRQVIAVNKSAGSAATRFRLPIHDVSSWNQVREIMQNLEENYPMTVKPFIMLVEVSFDRYCHGADEDTFLELVLDSFRMLKNPPSDNLRIVGMKGSAEAAGNRKFMKNHLLKGKTIYIGNHRKRNNKQADPISMRFYYKTIDNNQILGAFERRARYEITLQGEACPFRTLEEARAFNFTDLRDYFVVNKPKENLDAWNKFMIEVDPQPGKVGKIPRHNGGGYRKNKIFVIANAYMNSMIYEKLRELDKRLNSNNPRKTRVFQMLEAA